MPALAALRDHLFELRKKGFNRLFQTGKIFEFSTPESLLDVDFSRPVFLLVDRLAIPAGGSEADLHQRLVDTVETCYREAGEAIFENAADGQHLRFNEKFQCKTCGMVFAEPEPILFSFNSPFGACPRCQGFGNTIDFDMDRVIPDRTLSLADGAVDPWTKPKHRSWLANFQKHAKGSVRGGARSRGDARRRPHRQPRAGDNPSTCTRKRCARADPFHHARHVSATGSRQMAWAVRSNSAIMRIVRKQVLLQVLRGTADANIRFDDLRSLLTALGFVERVKGSHHIFARPDVAEILNLQPSGSLAKPYQVKQVRAAIVRYKLARGIQ